jgi:hypothetical protein
VPGLAWLKPGIPAAILDPSAEIETARPSWPLSACGELSSRTTTAGFAVVVLAQPVFGSWKTNTLPNGFTPIVACGAPTASVRPSAESDREPAKLSPGFGSVS